MRSAKSSVSKQRTREQMTALIGRRSKVLVVCPTEHHCLAIVTTNVEERQAAYRQRRRIAHVIGYRQREQYRSSHHTKRTDSFAMPFWALTHFDERYTPLRSMQNAHVHLTRYSLVCTSYADPHIYTHARTHTHASHKVHSASIFKGYLRNRIPSSMRPEEIYNRSLPPLPFGKR